MQQVPNIRMPNVASQSSYIHIMQMQMSIKFKEKKNEKCFIPMQNSFQHLSLKSLGKKVVKDSQKKKTSLQVQVTKGNHQNKLVAGIILNFLLQSFLVTVCIWQIVQTRGFYLLRLAKFRCLSVLNFNSSSVSIFYFNSLFSTYFSFFNTGHSSSSSLYFPFSLIPGF